MNKSHDEKNKGVSYYTTFRPQERAEPACVYIGANAGLKNKMYTAIQMPSFSALQVVCYCLISHQVKLIQSLH